MTINASPIATKTMDLITPVSNYSLYMCHEASGETVLVDSAPAAKQLFGDITLSSATSSFDSINYAPDGTQEQRDITATSVSGYNMAGVNGQFIVAFDILADAAPSTAEDILCCGRAISGEGHFRINILSSGVAGRVSIVHTSAADGSTVVQKNGDIAGNVYDGSRHSVMCYVDMINLKLGMYIDGVSMGSEQAIASAADLVIGLPATTFGAAFFCRPISAAYASTLFGSASTGTKINRLLVMKTTTDQSANLASIASGLSDIAHELPWELDSV